MPKWGAGEVYDQALSVDLGPEGPTRQGASLTKGQILWLRGITRLQTQVCTNERTRMGSFLLVLGSTRNLDCAFFHVHIYI